MLFVPLTWTGRAQEFMQAQLSAGFEKLSPDVIQLPTIHLTESHMWTSLHRIDGEAAVLHKR
jgi:hypothetical protein